MSHFELVAKTAMFTGVLGIGVALGASIGLVELQSSCVAAGKLPTAGSPLFGVDLDENACWTGAKRMQSIANGSGLVGAVLTVGGGVLDAYEGRIREVLS